MIRRIGILTSGGDAPGMNAAIRSVARTCLHYDVECICIRRGFNGLISGDFMPLNAAAVKGISRRGGTILYAARSDEFRTPEGKQKAVNTCKMIGLDGLIGIGGDGTFQGLHSLAVRGVPVIAIPGTIDNDIACSSYTIGFDTACNTALDAIDKLQDTMESHERCSLVEVMGRNAGHIALNVGMACAATAVLLPEKPFELERDVIEPIRDARLSGRTHFMIIVAEGAGDTYEIAKQITEVTTLDTRVTVLGHVQRGGAPTSRDRAIATYMGYNAVELLMQGKSDRVVCMRGDAYVDFDITEALTMRKGIDEKAYRLLRDISSVVD